MNNNLGTVYLNSLNEENKGKFKSLLYARFNFELDEYEIISNYIFNNVSNKTSYETFTFILKIISKYLNEVENTFIDNDIGMMTVEDRKNFRLRKLNELLDFGIL